MAGDFAGVVVFPAGNEAYRIEAGGAGGAELVRHAVKEVICVDLPPPPATTANAVATTAQVSPGDYPNLPIPPYQNGIITLQSLPGAVAVVYLDFQGGYTPTWGGVNYAAPNTSNAQIRDVWRQVTEDFMPFTINVTTDLGVFQNAPEGSRQHVIITPTTIAAPGEGGTAYIGSFNWTGDTPCWVFETSGKNCAEACSHEVGHSLGLIHDGQEYNGIQYEYYSGSGVGDPSIGDTSWAPIMGLPFAANVTQWCKGEYLYANNHQDQLALIVSQNNHVAYRPPDVGGTLATARYLDLFPDYSASAEGIIKRTGETNAFRFTTAGGSVFLRADPVSFGPDLAIQAAIYDGSDNLLMSTNPQTTLWAALSTNLPAGTFTFRVSGAGRNSPLTNGFSNYASLGYYSITGTVANAQLPQRFAIPEYSTNGTIIGAVTPNNGNEDPLSFTIVSGNQGNTFGIEAEGTLYLADQDSLNANTQTPGTQFPVEFELLVNINDLANPSLTETNCRVLVDVTYVPTPPAILSQSQDQTVFAGTNAYLSVTAIGDTPLAYQWWFNQTLIPGGTAAVLALTNVQSGNAGEYVVVITNSLGSITNAPVLLGVQAAAPLVVQQPQSQSAFPGFGVAFSVAAEGTAPLSYQWQFDGTNLSGATSSSLAIPSVQSQNAGSYRVLVRNPLGLVISAEAILTMVEVAAWGSDAYGQTNLPIGVSEVVQICAGANHNLALRRDGSVLAWGASLMTNVPATLTNAIAISAGGAHSLALTSIGTVAAWGDDRLGQTDVPADLTNVLAIAAGGDHSLALGSDGLIRAWGLNSLGQTRVPAGLTNAVAIAAGSNHSLALGPDGKVYGWGDNRFGQAAAPTNLNSVVAISAGGNHSLALRNDGTVVAWGENLYGQCNVPTGLVNVVAIAAGSFHSLALDSFGNLTAWGAGLTNKASYPHLGQSIIPRSVRNLTAISAGDAHSLALGGDGAPFITEPPLGRTALEGQPVLFRACATGARPLSYQWQFNGVNLPGATRQVLTFTNAFATNAGQYRVIVTNGWGVAISSSALLGFSESPPLVAGQPLSQQRFLGNRILLQASVYGSQPMFYQWRFNGADLPGATRSALILDRLRLDQDGYYYLVASNAFGTVASAKAGVDAVQLAAWGDDTYGQTNIPPGLSGVVSVAGGLYHSLALKQDGTVVAWGAQSQFATQNYGQLDVPPDLTNAVAIAAGGYHSLALKSDGTVVAWGAGSSNSIARNYNFGQSTVPVGLHNVVAIAAGQVNSVALRSDGQVIVWGSSTGANVPGGAANATAISACNYNFLALRWDGSVVDWGTGLSLPGFSSVVAVAAGANFGLALQSNGKIAAWGGISRGPAGLSNVVQVAAGWYNGLALDGNGQVWAWGGMGMTQVPTGLVYTVDVAAGQYHGLVVAGDGSPVIKLSPVDQTVQPGGAAMFLVRAGGLQPLHYKWQLNGTALPGATNSVLRLTNLQDTDSGGYSVVVGNLFGAVTSRVARLSVPWDIGRAVNAPGLTWTSNGDALWFGQTNYTHDGVVAAQSGPIGDNQQSSIQTTITGPGTLSFWWKVSSEQWFDFLACSIDAVQQAAISGEVDWQLETLRVPAGTHTLVWTYAKDPTVSVGLDAGWVGDVSFLADFPVITRQPLSQTVDRGSTVLLSVEAVGDAPLSYQWMKNGNNLAGATDPSFSVIAQSRIDSGIYAVGVSNGYGTTPSSNAVVRVRVPQKLKPLAGTVGTFAFVSSDVDGGLLEPADVSNFVIQVSEDLFNWTPLTGSIVLTNGVLLLQEAESISNSAQFYRILEQ